MEADFLADYDFRLPTERIAQKPPSERGASKLLVLNKQNGSLEFSLFKRLLEHLPPSLLVFNDVKVTPARIYGQKATGGRVEALFLDLPPLNAPEGSYELWCLAKPGRRLKIGSHLIFSGTGSDSPEMSAEVIEKSNEGRTKIRFDFPAPPHDFLAKIGHMPLPPYLKRPADDNDQNRYQTVYAQAAGAVAAPTAGLHFTDSLLRALPAAGHQLAWLTLWVGLGTFAPLSSEQLAQKRLHQEEVLMPAETAQALRLAKKEGRKITAVGTTSARVIEWSVLQGQGEPIPWQGPCDLFIQPGHKFYLESLITNFHLPRSSLLMLVAALAGREPLLNAYCQAIERHFQFYSYGDAMLII